MEKVKYKTTDKFTNEVINEILDVEMKQGLTAENLLEKAKNKKSNLHELFEWDNTIASGKWRVYQARQIINEVKIFVEDKEIYAFENVQVKVMNENDEVQSSRKYKSVMEVFTTDEYRNQMIQSALDNIKYWKQKYKGYSELDLIFNSIDKVEKKWQKKKK